MRDEHLGRDHAIVGPTAAAQHINVRRMVPSARWEPFVEYFWLVRWSCDLPHAQQVIPQPCIHVAAEIWDGVPRLLVNGVTRKPFTRTLHGTGHTLGAAFRPASFRALLGADVGTVSGRTIPMAELTGRDDVAAASAILDAEVTDERMVDVFEGYLDLHDAAKDPVAERINALVRVAETDRSLVRASQLAEMAGVSLRTLERQFTAYLGIGPKWVVQRFRLLDAAAAAHTGAATDWAALADELGFSDQAHLTRAFTAVVGTPPATYQREA
ncbi:AraC family transcriptional regulator [Spelaeicoccus albus]|uniref:AraC-like DNA-binding protein n=1 Tax=Spelaeicoccus albus TaxID=1280376 RepID=A0A7Z0AAM9_9MICO|nr:helix-turn-helix domain-containing protein [Spelaeicoccus albus]NYI66410.1 AraC-like DNA-binding protein [Spelaeicoccus albus]